MLTLDQIDRLVGEVAATTLAPGVVNRIFSEAVIDSAGRDALRITIVIDDDALSKISGDATVDTLVAVQKRLFEAGEESFQSSSTPRSESSRKVAILNPEHLLEQAERLIEPPPAGPPRQVDIRRAISSAYYAVFHATLAAAADEFIGVMRTDRRYGLVYRSIDHRAFAELCTEASRSRPTARYARYSPEAGFVENIQAFASTALELQEKRHSADYDPTIRVRTADAKLAIGAARSALRRYGEASENLRKSFLALLLFRPR
jgi:uncharacterized protein (UPF0332 family)